MTADIANLKGEATLHTTVTKLRVSNFLTISIESHLTNFFPTTSDSKQQLM